MAARIHQILRGLWLVHWCIAPGLVFGLKLAINPDPKDSPLIPGNILHVQSTPEQGDPAKVNLYIYNTVQNTRTELWVGLEPANSIHSLFEIPPLPPGKQYVVRATQTSGEFLVDSPIFEILAGTSTTSASSVSSTSSNPSKSNASTLSSSPSITSAPPSTGSSKPPIGAIVGGVLGGLVLIVMILGLLVWLRRRQQNETGTAADHEKPWVETVNRQLEPFTAMQPPALSSPSTNSSLKGIPPRAAPPSSAGESNSSGSEPTSSTPLSSAFPLSSSSPPASDSKSARFATRSELERQKRRINQQMAIIQNRSPVSGHSESGNSARHDDADLRQELNDMRAQIRQLELRQTQNTAPAWQDDTPEEPPPGYNR